MSIFNPRPLVHLYQLMTMEEMSRLKNDSTGRALEITQKYFVDISIGDLIYINSVDVFETVDSQMLIEMLYRRFNEKLHP